MSAPVKMVTKTDPVPIRASTIVYSIGGVKIGVPALIYEQMLLVIRDREMLMVVLLLLLLLSGCFLVTGAVLLRGLMSLLGG